MYLFVRKTPAETDFLRTNGQLYVVSLTDVIPVEPPVNDKSIFMENYKQKSNNNEFEACDLHLICISKLKLFTIRKTFL